MAILKTTDSATTVPMAYLLAAGTLVLLAVFKAYTLGMRTKNYPPGKKKKDYLPRTLPLYVSVLPQDRAAYYTHGGQSASDAFQSDTSGIQEMGRDM